MPGLHIRVLPERRTRPQTASACTGLPGRQPTRSSQSVSSPQRRRRIAGMAGVALCAAILVSLLAGPGPAEAQEAGLGLPPGTPAPDAQVQDLDGNPVSLHDLIDGRPALLKFWATWCEQCEALQPRIDEVVERFGDEVAVIAVAVAVNQNPRRIRRHIEAHAPPYPFVYDARGEAVRAYQALTTAVVVLVDGQGSVVSTGVGPDQELAEAMAALMGD